MDTALLKIKPDLLDAVDRKEEIGLVFHDLSAMFNTICHRLLQNKLHYHYGIEEVTLESIKTI